MIPSRRALLLLAGWLLLGALASAIGQEPAWWGLGALLALGFGVEAIDLWRCPTPRVRRRAPGAFSMGVRAEVALRLENPGRRRVRLQLFDRHPEWMQSQGLPAKLVLGPNAGAELSYRLLPLRRGRHHFEAVALRIQGRLGLLESLRTLPLAEEVRVYPNFRAAAGYELLAAHNRAGAVGIRRRPRRGEGLEFHQLREYREGDSLRQIDWKATARLGRAISREYQDERDQQVVFLLDCGRRMLTAEGGRAHFDAVLDAVLITARAALRQGDSVGLLTFSGPRRWLAPRKGVAQLNALLAALFDLESGLQAPDYAAAARDLLLRIRKRSLVICVSNVRDEDGDELGSSLELLAPRHLVLLASLREPALASALHGEVVTLADALRVGATRRYLTERSDALARHAKRGAILLDSEPERLPISLVNRYLDVKAAGVL